MKQRNFNFRKTASDRRARDAYSNFKRTLSHHVNNIVFNKLKFKKYGKS